MFPISDVIPSRTTPYVTIGLIVANTLAFLYELQLEPAALRALVHDHGLVPAAFTWTSVLTGMFLHVGWVHILGNMLYLWIFGDNVEDSLGHAGFLAFYLGCGAAGALGQVAASPHSLVPVIGASGAVAGVMGAYFVLYPRSRVLAVLFLVIFLDIVEIPAVYFLGVWFLLQLFSGVGSIGANAADGGIAFWSHVAGFGVGMAFGTLYRLLAGRRYWQESRSPRR